MKTIIAIDPGLSGAIAILKDGFEPEIIDTPTYKTPKGKRDFDIPMMAAIFDPYRNGDTAVLLESVGVMPGQGGVSNFTFGRGKGIWEGILGAFRLSVHQVRPQAWKQEYPELLPPVKEKGKKKTKVVLSAAETKELAKQKRLFKVSAKAKARELASKLHPELAHMLEKVKDDGRAESLLMALYLKKRIQGDNNVR